MDEIHDEDRQIAKECKVTIEEKPSAAAPFTLPDMLDFGSFFFVGSSVSMIQKSENPPRVTRWS